MIYDNPHDLLHDIQTGKLHPRHITLEQWLISSGYAMVDSKLPQLNINIMANGTLYTMHHCLKAVYYPNAIQPILENTH